MAPQSEPNPGRSRLTVIESELIGSLPYLDPFNFTNILANSSFGASNAIFSMPQFHAFWASSTPPPKFSHFLALAARAYQEAVKLPEEPPPSVWGPNDKMHSYYEWLLNRFGAVLQSKLQDKGIFDVLIFRNEWLRHGRSITDNIRAEWGLHPLGSTAAVKTTLENEYTSVARSAIEIILRFPEAPPPQGWKLGDSLHPYYNTMLCRFHNHMCDLIEQHGTGLFPGKKEATDAVNGYKEYIIHEYRKTWLQAFGA